MAMRTMFEPRHQAVCDRCSMTSPPCASRLTAAVRAVDCGWWQDPDHPDNFLCPTCSRHLDEELQAQDYHDELTHALRVEAGMG